MSERCSVLSESVKSLEERVKQKTSELTETQERYECVRWCYVCERCAVCVCV